MIKCYSCNRPGHISRECPFKQTSSNALDFVETDGEFSPGKEEEVSAQFTKTHIERDKAKARNNQVRATYKDSMEPDSLEDHQAFYDDLSAYQIDTGPDEPTFASLTSAQVGVLFCDFQDDVLVASSSVPTKQSIISWIPSEREIDRLGTRKL